MFQIYIFFQTFSKSISEAKKNVRRTEVTQTSDKKET